VQVQDSADFGCGEERAQLETGHAPCLRQRASPAPRTCRRATGCRTRRLQNAQPDRSEAAGRMTGLA
jgi:hypothetical protein